MPPLMDTPLQLLTMEVMVTKNPNTTAQFKTLLKSPKCASQLSKRSVPMLNWPSKSLSTKNSTTKSPVQCVLNPSTSSTMKSVLINMNKRKKHRQDCRSDLRKERRCPNGRRLPTRTPWIRIWILWTQLLQGSCPNHRLQRARCHPRRCPRRSCLPCSHQDLREQTHLSSPCHLQRHRRR